MTSTWYTPPLSLSLFLCLPLLLSTSFHSSSLCFQWLFKNRRVRFFVYLYNATVSVQKKNWLTIILWRQSDVSNEPRLHPCIMYWRTHYIHIYAVYVHSYRLYEEQVLYEGRNCWFSNCKFKVMLHISSMLQHLSAFPHLGTPDTARCYFCTFLSVLFCYSCNALNVLGKKGKWESVVRRGESWVIRKSFYMALAHVKVA